MSQCCLLSMVLSCEMPSCLCGIFLPRATLTGERRQRPRATITATQTSSGTNLSPYLQSLPIETAHAIFKENWISEVHICLKDSISMNPHGEYELIKAKSDPRAEVRLRWVKVVGATYNGGPDLPSTSVVALRNRIRRHPQLAEGLEMLLQVIPGCLYAICRAFSIMK